MNLAGFDLAQLDLVAIKAEIERQQELRKYDWKLHARPKQLPPPGNWRYWVLRWGRGSGKTRTGAEFIRSMAQAGKHPRIALIGPTAADVRDVMIEGDSGILSCSSPDFMPLYEPSKRQLTWPNGVIGKTYSADEPDRLRGPQHHAGWLDELSAFEYPEAFTQFKLGFRLGTNLRCIITMTPKPCAVVRELDKQSKDGTGRVIMSTGSTYENEKNLAPEFFTEVIRQYEGTRLGRQELQGELLEDTPGALWNTLVLDRTRVAVAPPMVRIVVSIDPSVTASDESDECGITVSGKGIDSDLYMLEDASGVMTPHEWASLAIRLFHKWNADVIVAETNNGGDLVGNTILAIDPSVPFRKVTASRGKHLRAEPISALWEQNRAHLVGNYERLEEQMCQMSSEGYTGRGSPDRLDSAVHGATELMLNGTTVQMFPDFRAAHRGNSDPATACHVYDVLSYEAQLKDWWTRWVSVSFSLTSAAAHWWAREPNGRIRIYRELLAQDATPEEFGRDIAERSRQEAANHRMLPVWMGEEAFKTSGGKCLAVSVAEGIQKSLGAHKSFLFVHNEEEKGILDPLARWKAIQSRLERMPKGFLSVQKLPGADSTGWDIVREMLRWRSNNAQASTTGPDWDYARTLVKDYPKFEAYIAQFAQPEPEVLPILKISNDCKGMIQAMSGAVRTPDDTALAMGGGTFVLQSLRLGCMAAREDSARQPMEEFIGARLDALPEDAAGISKHLAVLKAREDYTNRHGSGVISFARRRR
jgi:phage terminase large subunit-like protein